MGRGGKHDNNIQFPGNAEQQARRAAATSPDPRKMQVDIANAKTFKCERCQNTLFQPAVMFKEISALISPNGEEGLVPIQTYMCVGCGYVNPEFRPFDPENAPTDSSQPESTIITTDT